MEFMPPVHVQKIGTPQFPRFVMRDGIGQFWTGTSWSENPREAELYYTKADAVAAENRYADGEHHVRDTYTLKLVIVTDRDAWTRGRTGHASHALRRVSCRKEPRTTRGRH